LDIPENMLLHSNNNNNVVALLDRLRRSNCKQLSFFSVLPPCKHNNNTISLVITPKTYTTAFFLWRFHSSSWRNNTIHNNQKESQTNKKKRAGHCRHHE
jgi:hypothetical protein